jgi:hypothetical protein
MRQVVRREDHHLAELTDHLIALAFLLEKALDALRGHVLDNALGINARGGFLQRGLIDVRGEDLHVQRLAGHIQRLLHEHRHRIGLLAGGTGRHPDAKPRLRRPRDEPRYDLLL